jgi:hypothetical protein
MLPLSGKFTLEIITLLFPGGAKQQPELRPTSVRCATDCGLCREMKQAVI